MPPGTVLDPSRTLRCRRGSRRHDAAASSPTASAFALRFGRNPPNAAFVTTPYPNALHREPDQVRLTGWVGAPDQGRIDRAFLAVSLSESAEHRLRTDPVPITGIPPGARHLGIAGY